MVLKFKKVQKTWGTNGTRFKGVRYTVASDSIHAVYRLP